MQSASGLLIAYVAAASLLTVTPGIDTALVLRTAATRPLARFLAKPSVVQVCDRLTGGMFLAFGLGPALDSRRP
jgi:threonine/homoserine/homoserine lactone efflux protein